jgi:hypothetical protein
MAGDGEREEEESRVPATILLEAIIFSDHVVLSHMSWWVQHYLLFYECRKGGY